MLKIGFGNVAQPDFAFHAAGIVRFGNIAKPYYSNNRTQFLYRFWQHCRKREGSEKYEQTITSYLCPHECQGL